MPLLCSLRAVMPLTPPPPLTPPSSTPIILPPSPPHPWVQLNLSSPTVPALQFLPLISALSSPTYPSPNILPRISALSTPTRSLVLLTASTAACNSSMYRKVGEDRSNLGSRNCCKGANSKTVINWLRRQLHQREASGHSHN
jgi:hypothetical protein